MHLSPTSKLGYLSFKLQMMQFQRGHTRHNFVSHTSREAISKNNLEKISKRIHSKLNHIVISVAYQNFYFPGKTSSKATYFTEI